jgi:anti-sigma factor RsiW
VNCHECHERLAEYALGLLPTDEAQDVRAHLAHGCDDCQQELAALNGAVSILGDDLPPVDPPAAVWTTIEQRIASQQVRPIQLASTVQRPAAARVLRSLVPYLAASLAGIVVGGSLVRWDPKADTHTPLAAKISEAQGVFGAPRAQLARLGSLHAGAGGAALLSCDAVAGELHFVATGWPAPAADKQYWLWVQDAAGERRGRIPLEVSTAGGVSLVAPLPPAGYDLTTTVVTEESLPVSKEPAGEVRFSVIKSSE